jgi:hypothetical protein
MLLVGAWNLVSVGCRRCGTSFRRRNDSVPPRTDLIGWTRFGILAIKELHVWYKAGGIDANAVDEYGSVNFRRMLKSGVALRLC